MAKPYCTGNSEIRSSLSPAYEMPQVITPAENVKAAVIIFIEGITFFPYLNFPETYRLPGASLPP
jgi:hypothetical protein